MLFKCYFKMEKENWTLHSFLASDYGHIWPAASLCSPGLALNPCWSACLRLPGTYIRSLSHHTELVTWFSSWPLCLPSYLFVTCHLVFLWSRNPQWHLELILDSPNQELGLLIWPMYFGQGVSSPKKGKNHTLAWSVLSSGSQVPGLLGLFSEVHSWLSCSPRLLSFHSISMP